MSEPLFGALVDIFLTWAGAKNGPGTVDVIGNGNTVIAPPICTLAVINAGYDGSVPRECGVTVTCNDALNVYDFTPQCASIDGTFSANDPNVGEFEIYFTKPNTNPSPFPGIVWIKTPQYTISYGGDKTHDLALSTCVNAQKDFIGTDCSGNAVQLKLCTEGFPDFIDRTPTPRNRGKYGYAYYIAIPKLSASKNLGCEK